MSDGHLYKKIITTGADKDATHIAFYAKATGLFFKLFGATEKTIAQLESPAFTGTPTALTQPVNDNSTKLATTAYADRHGTLLLQSATHNPADATTYFIGNMSIAPFTTESLRSFICPFTGTITSAAVWVSGTAGTSEGVTLKIRNVTAATTITLTSSADWSAFPYKTNFTGLSVAVTAGDIISFQYDTPTWVTNPTGVLSSVIYVIR